MILRHSGTSNSTPHNKKGWQPATTGRTSGDVKSLSDIIEQRLFKFLFSEEDVYEPNFGALVGEVEEWLTNETSAGPKLRTTEEAPQTFQELLDWFKMNKANKEFFGDAHAGTKGKLLRRLKYVVQEGDGPGLRTVVCRPAEVDAAPAKWPGCTATVFHQLAHVNPY